jgi:hypothetical protein
MSLVVLTDIAVGLLVWCLKDSRMNCITVKE